MQVTFKATKAMSVYHGTLEFVDGQTKEMTDAEAERVAKDFPANFKLNRSAAKQVEGAKNKAVG